MGEFSEKWDDKQVFSKKKYYMQLIWAGGLGGAIGFVVSEIAHLNNMLC